MDKRRMNYKRAVHLLGQLEDRMGNSADWLEFEAAFNKCVETGKHYSFLIARMTKRLDELTDNLRYTDGGELYFDQLDRQYASRTRPETR